MTSIIVVIIILNGLVGLILYNSIFSSKSSPVYDKGNSSYTENANISDRNISTSKNMGKNNTSNKNLNDDKVYNTVVNHNNNTENGSGIDKVKFTPEYFSFRDSSRLSPGNGFTYYPENVVDNNPVSCWAEGSSGSGIGESFGVSYKNNDKVSIGSIKIMNGCCESEKVYYYNNRIKDVRLYLDNIDVGVFTLSDVYRNYQVIDLGKTYEVKDIILKIESVYHGNKFDDTCISELRVE